MATVIDLKVDDIGILIAKGLKEQIKHEIKKRVFEMFESQLEEIIEDYTNQVFIKAQTFKNFGIDGDRLVVNFEINKCLKKPSNGTT